MSNVFKNLGSVHLGPVGRDVISSTYINCTLTSVATETGEIYLNLKREVASFTGRDWELKEIRKTFQNENEQATPSTSIVIIGQSGTGKTELSRKYAYDNLSYYQNIIWIDSETSGNIKSTFESLAKNHLGKMKNDGNWPIEVTTMKVYEYLSQSRTLIIFDNAEGYAIIEPFLPPLIKGNIKNIHILFTSQTKDWDVMDEGKIKDIHLKYFMLEEAKEFVKKTLNQKNVDDNDIEKLIKKLAFFPLALTQAIAYINHQHRNVQKVRRNESYAVADYLIEYRHQTMKLLDHTNTIHHRYGNTVFKTLEIEFEKLSKEENGNNALDVMTTIAYLAPNNLDICNMFDVDENAILLLDKYSMIRISGGVASIHRLVQQVTRLRNKQNEIASLEKAMTALNMSQNNDYDKFIHVVIVWRYAVKHNTFIRQVSSYTYGYQKLTPVHIFVMYGNYEATNYLLANIPANQLKAVCNYKDSESNTPLHLAFYNYKFNIVKLLIEKGSDINAKNHFGQTALHYATNCNFEIVKFLIDNGVDVNATSKNGETPLQIAFLTADTDVIKFLIECGSDVSVRDGNGDTPLHTAAARNMDITKFLIENDSNVHARNAYFETALHVATDHEHLDIIKILLENGSNVNSTNENGETPLYRSVRTANVDIIKFLIENGADIDFKDRYGETPIHAAARRNDEHLNIIELLIDQGADINATDAYGRTPMHLAASAKENVNIIKLLIENGADVNAKDDMGSSPMQEAVRNQNLDIINCLNENGAHVKAMNNSGKTFLPPPSRLEFGVAGSLSYLDFESEREEVNQSIRDLDYTDDLYDIDD